MSTSAEPAQPVEPWQPILDSMTRLRDAWPAQGWSWDHRFKCVTSAIPAADVPAVRALLAAIVPAEWTQASFATAPEPVRALAARCGELRSNQLLLTGDAGAGMTVFAMWWPWGDGSQVSVRLGIAGSDRPKELYPVVRALFGIT